MNHSMLLKISVGSYHLLSPNCFLLCGRYDASERLK